MYHKPYKMLKYKFHLSTVIICLLTLVSCEYERVTTPDVCDEAPVLISLDQANSQLSIECGTEDGTIVIESENQALEYSINGGNFTSNASFANLGAGTYSIIARTASNGCTSEPLVVDIVNENGLIISLAQSSNADCGSSNGSINISQSNGAEPVTYSLNGSSFQTSAEFNNLSPDSYDIVARDANGCEASISNIEITTGVSLSADIQPIIQNNCAVTGCHSGSQPPNFTDKQNILNNASRIKSRTSAGSMPPSGREDLTEQEIALIACWVDDGALDN